MSSYNYLVKSFNNKGIKIEENALLAQYTSFKIGGSCKFLVKPNNADEIIWTIQQLNNANIDYYLLGNGSNVLVCDNGYNGAIILIGDNLSKIEVKGDCITSQAGASLSKLCSQALQHSLGGLEFAFGIPGTVGGAVYMNAGAYGGEIKDVIKDCTFIDEQNNIKTLTNKELELSYRHSIFSNKKCCIIKATFQLKNEKKELIKQRMDDYITRRKTKQPLQYPSAGSTFKRPEGNYASALIDSCGLKGLRVGGAVVSTKHCGFIINDGNATCEDVLELIEQIKNIVFKKTGYKLECEVKTLGI